MLFSGQKVKVTSVQNEQARNLVLLPGSYNFKLQTWQYCTNVYHTTRPNK